MPIYVRNNPHQDKSPVKYKTKLDKFYRIVKDQILRYQHPISGLFPLEPDNPTCNVSHVRDSVYCATVAWALHKCYERVDDDEGRTYELGQCAVKCMRAILCGWMQQATKLEDFKNIQNSETCIHSLLNYETGSPDVMHQYHHLQLDCVCLYLLQMVQMIQSGLQIIYSKSEVSFIQNLIFYIERAYRIPDFGIWERGSKQNKNVTELHASSIGMAKAALEAMSGFNLFGAQGDHSSVVFADSDAHSRNRIIMSNLLPRESASKGSDSGLLPTMSWPCYATHTHVRETTVERILSRFEGRYGFKRFSRDGYRTVLEERPLYQPGELKKFENIENEWPMFLAYMVIDSCFAHDWEKAEAYNKKLTALLEKDTQEKYPWLPKFYYVPVEGVDREKASPGSVKRYSSFRREDWPKFLWGQSVYIISQLLMSGSLFPHDLDPLSRHIPADERPISMSSRYSSLMGKPLNLVIQVVLISESVRLQQMLATFGIQTQTPQQVEPLQIWPPDNLVRLGKYMGCCRRLGLSGRPARPVGQLGTSKFYRIAGRTVICYPLLFEMQDFYLLHDMSVVVDECKSDFVFLANWWRMKGRPTFCILIREDMIKAPDNEVLINFLASMKTGRVDGVRVLVGRAQNFVASGCVEHLDYLPPNVTFMEDLPRVRQLDVSKSFRSLTDITKHHVETLNQTFYSASRMEHFSSESLCRMLSEMESSMQQAIALHILSKRHGLDSYVNAEDRITVKDKLMALCSQAGVHLNWSVVRFCSSLLGKFVNSLAPSISAILVCGKQLTIGMAKCARDAEVIIFKPLNPNEIRDLLLTLIYPHSPSDMVLVQELILWVSSLLTKDKSLFENIAFIRMGWLIECMKLELKYHGEDEAVLYTLSPTKVKILLEEILRLNYSLTADGECIFDMNSRRASVMKLPYDMQPHSVPPDTPGGKFALANLQEVLFGKVTEGASRSSGGDAPLTEATRREILRMRQLDGCLARVPTTFYTAFYAVLMRAPRGVTVAGRTLHQVPTLMDMTATDLNFVDEVERLLQPICNPAFRSILVEQVMIIASILERNIELCFNNNVDIDDFIHHAVAAFAEDHCNIKADDFLQMEKSDNRSLEVYELFYSTPPNVRLGTVSYMAKIAVDRMLASDMNLLHVNRNTCSVS